MLLLLLFSNTESVVPHLMLLAGIMEEDHEIRPMVLDYVFPPEYRDMAGEPCIEFVTIIITIF